MPSTSARQERARRTCQLSPEYPALDIRHYLLLRKQVFYHTQPSSQYALALHSLSTKKDECCFQVREDCSRGFDCASTDYLGHRRSDAFPLGMCIGLVALGRLSPVERAVPFEGDASIIRCLEIGRISPESWSNDSHHVYSHRSLKISSSSPSADQARLWVLWTRTAWLDHSDDSDELRKLVSYSALPQTSRMYSMYLTHTRPRSSCDS